MLLLKAVANALLFAPLGAALAFRGISIRRALLFGVALSTSIEIVQWFGVPGRTSSADDVLLNTVGTAIGYLLVLWLRPSQPDQKT